MAFYRTLAQLAGPGSVVAALERGATVSTEVYDPEKSKAAGPVCLKPGDEKCAICEELIDPADYPSAGYANLLARLRLKYEATACEAHLPELQAGGK